MGDKANAKMIMACIRTIRGSPNLKYQCLVLCLNVNIPIVAPMLPPIIANAKRVASGIRKAFLRALRLSIPIKANPIIFTTAI